MKLNAKYLVLTVITVLLCLTIVTVNYIEYTNGRQLVSTDISNESTDTYSVIIERSTSETDEPQTININTATAGELADFLPGIGKTKSENIVAYRDAIGGFKSVDELIEVSGIGEATLESIRGYCRVSDD